MEFLAKVLVIGNSGVGKTSLCRRYINDRFDQAHKPTVGVEFNSKERVSKENNKFSFQFWDIGGQERYIYMTHVYYKNADFCLIMFDLMNIDSFRACAKWKQDLDKKYRMPNGSPCPCLLIGNKCDLNKRAVNQLEIEDFCKEYDFFGYIEVSVKNDIMVKETIEYVQSKIIDLKELEIAEQIKSTEKECFNFKSGKTIFLNEDTSKVTCLSALEQIACCKI